MKKLVDKKANLIYYSVKAGEKMFGYVVANKEKLTEEEKNVYQSCYCGLCKALKERGRFVSTLTLNYDMAFLVAVLISLYDKPRETINCRCAMSGKHMPCITGEITGYAADMNIILSYYKMLDDSIDDKSLRAKLLSKFLENKFKKACLTYPEKAKNIKKSLDKLREYELKNNLNPDIEAEEFGKIMAEIFTPYAEKKEELSQFGTALGKFIYIIDACMDLKKDIKKKRYNPLVFTDKSMHDDILKLLMADAVEAYEKLMINKNKGLIENILFSGVWTGYKREKNRK